MIFVNVPLILACVYVVTSLIRDVASCKDVHYAAFVISRITGPFFHLGTNLFCCIYDNLWNLMEISTNYWEVFLVLHPH